MRVAFGAMEEIMSWIGSTRMRAVVVIAGLLACAALALVVVQASASGAKPKAAGRSGLKGSLARRARAATETGLRVQGSSTASAIVDGSPSSVSCGQTITASTTLTENLECTENGLIIGASGVVLNLDGHFIRGEGKYIGVEAASGVTKDTVENGYVEEFEEGVLLRGADDAVTGIEVNFTTTGIYMRAPSEKATDDIASENEGLGIYVRAGDATVQSDHLLNNAGGVSDNGSGVESKFIDNVADGNTGDGMEVAGHLNTITGNVANFNGEFGIDAISPQIDGGGNSATGNGTKEQCRGVVCAP